MTFGLHRVDSVWYTPVLHITYASPTRRPMTSHRECCLQIHNIDGEWVVVNLQEKPDRPACAAFSQRQLFVLQTENSWKLMKYMP